MKIVFLLLSVLVSQSSFASEIKIRCHVTTIRGVTSLAVFNSWNYREDGNTRDTGSPWEVKLNNENVEGDVGPLENDRHRLIGFQVIASPRHSNKFFEIHLTGESTAIVFETDNNNKRISDDTSNCTVDRE